MSILTKTILILQKDLKCQMRSGVTLIAVPFFAILILAVLAFAFKGGNAGPASANLGAGILWVALIFSAVSTFNQTFASEKENACLKGLLLCPVDRSAIYIAKFMANFFIIGLSQVVIIPAFTLLFGLSGNLGALILVIVLGVIGLSAVGTLFSAISSASRLREILFPVLFFPIIIPLVVAGVGAGGQLLDGQPLSGVLTWLVVIIAYDVLFFALSVMIFEPAVEGS
jgi:heme exporter protein B